MQHSKKYIVYITHYKGDKLPTWYIGYTTLNRFKKGYNGSITSKRYSKIYKEEQANNKLLFRTKILSYHNSKEEALEEERRLHIKHYVNKNPKYMNMSISKTKFNHTGCTVIIKNGEYTSILSEEYDPSKHLTPAHGKVTVKEDNTFKQISKEEFLKGGYKTHTSGLVPVKDINGKISQITKEEFAKHKNKKYFHVTKGTKRNYKNEICYKCGFEGRDSQIKQWHNENCKVYKNFKIMFNEDSIDNKIYSYNEIKELHKPLIKTNINNTINASKRSKIQLNIREKLYLANTYIKEVF